MEPTGNQPTPATLCETLQSGDCPPAGAQSQQRHFAGVQAGAEEGSAATSSDGQRKHCSPLGAKVESATQAVITACPGEAHTG